MRFIHSSFPGVCSSSKVLHQLYVVAVGLSICWTKRLNEWRSTLLSPHTSYVAAPKIVDSVGQRWRQCLIKRIYIPKRRHPLAYPYKITQKPPPAIHPFWTEYNRCKAPLHDGESWRIYYDDDAGQLVPGHHRCPCFTIWPPNE